MLPHPTKPSLISGSIYFLKISLGISHWPTNLSLPKSHPHITPLLPSLLCVLLGFAPLLCLAPSWSSWPLSVTAPPSVPSSCKTLLYINLEVQLGLMSLFQNLCLFLFLTKEVPEILAGPSSVFKPRLPPSVTLLAIPSLFWPSFVALSLDSIWWPCSVLLWESLNTPWEQEPHSSLLDLFPLPGTVLCLRLLVELSGWLS